jgi:4-carboxymuconolactone decarboxylase
MNDRMPPLATEKMNDAQKEAAAELIAGPRKGVFGPFIPLMRSPELMDRLGRVGEYLRFHNTNPTKLNEFAILIASRHTTNQFEWAIHHPLAIKAGIARATLDALEQGRQPVGMADEEEVVYDFCSEVLATHHASDATYARALARFGEQGIVDLVGTVGYFVAICLVMNVAGTPAPKSDVPPLVALR